HKGISMSRGTGIWRDSGKDFQEIKLERGKKIKVLDLLLGNVSSSSRNCEYVGVNKIWDCNLPECIMHGRRLKICQTEVECTEEDGPTYSMEASCKSRLGGGCPRAVHCMNDQILKRKTPRSRDDYDRVEDEPNKGSAI
ncbi:MAG: hypothetical protein OXB84_08220, partial [Halobacteriovoraceae bacterium]|nr:hypothetical protein [Halobacteriovoraceae bacterium]